MIRYFCDGCKVEHSLPQLSRLELKSTELGRIHDPLAWTEREGHYCKPCATKVKVFMGELHFTATTNTVAVNCKESKS